MKVQVKVQFGEPSQRAWDVMQALASRLTDRPHSIRVSAQADAPDWLIVEFTMPAEPQYKAVDKIDRAVRLYASERLDSIIRFPKPEASR
jgi:hypothetical protein